MISPPDILLRSISFLKLKKTIKIWNRIFGKFWLRLLIQFSKSLSVWQDWSIFERSVDNFSYKSSPNIRWLLGLSWKPYVRVKTVTSILGETFVKKNWATFYSEIWPHWSLPVSNFDELKLTTNFHLDTGCGQTIYTKVEQVSMHYSCMHSRCSCLIT